jgi:poly-beta-1,6-N-acetyl-D-glucosamine synthase
MHLPHLAYLFSFTAVEIVFLGWLVTYVGVMNWLYRHYKRLEKNYGGDHQIFNVALIIPFRNEEKNIKRLAGQLAAFIPGSWEIIWVDDHSEDNSFNLIKQYIRTHGYKTWVLLSAEGDGKKRALQTGISVASAEIIVTTDADVVLSGDTFSQLIPPFTDPAVQLVAGPVISQRQTGSFNAFQQIEWASILLVTGAFFKIGKPLMCSGANLAFRKQAFEAVKGYQGNEQLMSGDDEFLLKKISKTYGSSAAVFHAKKESLVFVPPVQCLEEFLQQRIRWASKWQSHGSFMHAFSAFFAMIFTIAPFFSLLCYMSGELSGWVLGVIWTAKICCDKLVLEGLLRSLGLNSNWVNYFVAALLHPGFVLVVTFGVFRGGFVWKGRSSKLFR